MKGKQGMGGGAQTAFYAISGDRIALPFSDGQAEKNGFFIGEKRGRLQQKGGFADKIAANRFGMAQAQKIRPFAQRADLFKFGCLAGQHCCHGFDS